MVNCFETTFPFTHEWLEQLGIRTAFIEPGSPWKNGYNECFNGKLRDELLNRETVYNLKKSKDIDRELADRLQHSQTEQ